MSRQLAIAAQLLRAYPREVLILTAASLVAMPVGVVFLEVAHACLKG